MGEDVGPRPRPGVRRTPQCSGLVRVPGVTVQRASSRPGALGSAFAGLWGATAASNLADGLVLVLLPLLAVQLSDAPGAVAAVTVASTAAWPLFGLPAGWIVDTVDRRRLLTAVNLGRGGVLAAVAVAAMTDQLSLPLLYLAAVVLAIGETLADTALTTLVPMVVAPERRGAANARIETTINLLNQLAGPPLAGLLIAAGAAVAAGTTAALYALAVLGLLLLPRRPFTSPRPSAGTREDWRREITAGMTVLWRERLLRTLTLLTAGMNLAWAAWTALFVFYAVAPGPLGLDPAEYGLLLTAMAVGGLLAAPLADPLTCRLGVRAVLVLDLIGTVALVAAPTAGLGVLPVAACLIAAGAGATVWRAVVATIRQNVVDEQVMGRVYTASRFVSWGVLPAGAAIAGLLAQTAGTRMALAVFSALAAALVIAFPFAVRDHDLDSAYTGRRPDPDHDTTADASRGSSGRMFSWRRR
jgi:MFS family permease